MTAGDLHEALARLVSELRNALVPVRAYLDDAPVPADDYEMEGLEDARQALERVGELLR